MNLVQPMYMILVTNIAVVLSKVTNLCLDLDRNVVRCLDLNIVLDYAALIMLHMDWIVVLRGCNPH